jgi:hypothetical protein
MTRAMTLRHHFSSNCFIATEAFTGKNLTLTEPILLLHRIHIDTSRLFLSERMSLLVVRCRRTSPFIRGKTAL